MRYEAVREPRKAPPLSKKALDAAIFRIRPKTWVQFGINGDPKVSQAWRPRTIPDDPFQAAHPNVRGTVFFAWAVPNGRTTQVVINLRDNREVHDKEPNL